MSSSENILYELLDTVEWIVPQTSEEHSDNGRGAGEDKPPAPILPRILGGAQRLLSWVLPLAPRLTSQISDVLGCQSAWKVSYCSAGGGVVAVLQDAALEIRHAKHDFQDVIGCTDALHPDAHPQWRAVAWAASGSVLAVSFSDGVVQLFSTLAQHLYTIYPPRYTEGAVYAEPRRAIAALCISEESLPDPKWLCEVVCVEYSGEVRSYLVSAAEGYQTYATFSLTPHYPHGVTAAALHSSLLVVAGATPHMSDPSLNYYGVGHGITLWRRLDEYPHFKQVSSLPDDSYEPPSVSPFRRLYSKLVPPATPLTCAFCVRVSPCGKHLAALHLSGAVSVWHFPSLRKSKYWLLKDQPDAEVMNPVAASALKLLRQHGRKKKELKSSFPVGLEWWCRHDGAAGDGAGSLDDGLVLVRSSGSLTVSSSATLTNLLGDNPEFLSPHPMVCAPEAAQFLCLELERIVGRRKRTTTGTYAHSQPQVMTVAGEEYPEWSLEEEGEEGGAVADEPIDSQEGLDSSKESEGEEEVGYLAWLMLLFWQLLYWLTKDSRFLVRRSQVVSERYRLVQFQSSSPEQLYYNKIKAEEYGEALMLAQNYDLDSDLVYQSQWERSVPSVESISDYLSKVRCRAWVLQQCCTVVPPRLIPARELLLFGLRGTGLTVLINLGNGEDTGDCLSELTLYDCEDDEQRQQVLEREEQLSKQVAWEELTEAQLDLIKTRRCLLKYFDRLLTYELLLGGGHVAPERYDAAAYGALRQQSSVAACKRYARDGDADAVAVMWTHHGRETLPHRLALLSNFPPTLGPFEYRSVLPACDVNGEVLPWQTEPLRDVDWCEQHVSGINDADDVLDDVCGLYEAVKGVQQVAEGEGQLSVQVVSLWYQERARQLERECGLVDSALDLLKLGRERNVPGLEPLLQLLSSLEVLVYEAGFIHMSLDELSDLPSSQVLALMLDKSDGSNLLQRLREWVLPYLGRCEAAQQGARDTLLTQYLCSLARSNLAAVSDILKFATSSRQLLQGDALHKCAIECIYDTRAHDQLPVASAILDSLPRAADGDVRENLQLLEVQLWGCEQLRKRDVSLLPSDLRRMAPADAPLLYTKLARAALRRSPPLSLKEWRSLLDDMLELQQKLLTSTEPGQCYTSVAEALLTSGQSEYIDFGSSFLSLSPSPSPRDVARGGNPYLEGVSHREAVLLVLDAARGYFNSAEQYGDPVLKLAKHCLDLLADVEDKELQNEVQAERDLMAALEILHEFGVHQLPLQVRLCSDRESIVENAIEQSPGACLQYWWRVLQLGQLLKLEEDTARRETAVLVMLAMQAFKMEDVEACSSLCKKLMELGEAESWQVCSLLAQHPRLTDLPAKTKLANYALTHCPPQQLPALLNLRHSVELEAVYEVAKGTMVGEDLDPVEDVFLDAIESPVEDEAAEDGTVGGMMRGGRLLEATLGATHTVSAKATSLLSAVGKASFWTSAVSLVVPLRERAQEQSADQEDNSDFSCQGCHAFYLDSCPLAHCSNIGYDYSGYSNTGLNSPSLRFSLALLKASLLEHTIAAGCGMEESNAPDTKKDTTEKVVQELARAVLPEDTVFGLSLLLQLQQLQLAQDVLTALPTTDITIQVCQYYYALQIYSNLHPWQQPRIAPLYQHDPAVVIACAALVALKYKEDYDQQSPALPSAKGKAASSVKQLPTDIKLKAGGVKIFTGVQEVDEKLVELYDYFRSSEELLDDYVQGEALHRLDAGVDTVRFLNDPSYKEDTVLGLCMTTDPQMLDLAIVLARKYKVSLWEVHMTQLQYMMSSDLATDQVAENIKARNAMRELKNKPELFVETLRTKVLTLIDGTDHDRLVLFYSLIREAAEQAEEPALVTMKAAAEQHIGVLEELKKLAPSLSYHHLLTRQADTLSHLGAAVTNSNIKPLAALLLRVPSTAAPVTCSSLYCAYGIKRFFAGVESKAALSERQWVQRYEKDVSQYWPELSAEDALVLARELVLSEDAFKLVSLPARVAVSQVLLDSARASSEQDSDHQQEWSATVTELEAWVTHLKSLQSPAFTALVSGPDLALRHYAKMYATSDGSTSAAMTVCNKALLGGCDLAVLRELLEVMPEDAAPQPEDTLHSLVQRAFDALTGQGQQPDPLLPELLQRSSKNEQHSWWVERVQHLCSVLSCELQQDNDLLMEELLMDGAREVALCEDVSLHHRLTLFRAFIENLPASEEDKGLMLYLETRNVLAPVDFPVVFAAGAPTAAVAPAAAAESDESQDAKVLEVHVSSVSTSESREQLLEALLGAGSSPDRTRALLTLLQLWPPFSQEVYESLTGNPWEALLTRLVGECDATGCGLPGDVIWETVNAALAKQQLPTSSLGHISLELLGVGMTAWPLAAKVALLKHNPRAIDAVLQNYSIAAQQVRSSDYDDEMLQGFVNRGLVPRLVGTPLYEPCCQYLIRTGDSSVLQGVLQQLQLSHPTEAAALSQRVAVARPALVSITSAFKKVYSRLL